jgi:hypothetical protein
LLPILVAQVVLRSQLIWRLLAAVAEAQGLVEPAVEVEVEVAPQCYLGILVMLLLQVAVEVAVVVATVVTPMVKMHHPTTMHPETTLAKTGKTNLEMVVVVVVAVAVTGQAKVGILSLVTKAPLVALEVDQLEVLCL